MFFRTISSADAAIRTSGRTYVEGGGFPTFSTEKAQALSLTMKDLQRIGANDARRWIGYWQAKGFFG
jgi:hypothetical protein